MIMVLSYWKYTYKGQTLWTYAQYYSWCMDSEQFLHAAAVQSDPEGFIFIFIFQKGH